MIRHLLHFFYMGGYGLYVFGSYSLVLILLGVQWYFPWQRWQRYQNEQGQHESHS